MLRRRLRRGRQELVRTLQAAAETEGHQPLDRTRTVPQNPILALITPLLGGKKVLFPIPKHDREMVNYIKGLIESGGFKPVIERRYPLDEIVDAYPVCREDRQRRDQRRRAGRSTALRGAPER
jgi:NADPH:quinone reductase-like Zn-dependent oxidoreductase